MTDINKTTIKNSTEITKKRIKSTNNSKIKIIAKNNSSTYKASIFQAKLNYTQILRKRTLKGLRKRIQNINNKTTKGTNNIITTIVVNNDENGKNQAEKDKIVLNSTGLFNECFLKKRDTEALKVEIGEQLHFSFETNSNNYQPIEVVFFDFFYLFYFLLLKYKKFFTKTKKSNLKM